MSHYVTPFLVFNLGAEMVFVIAQRLEAQNITSERAALVLEEIVSVLISKQLITDLMKPQAAYSHDAVREIIEDVTQSSVMRLDSNSMSKLWDLITMVFKWQCSLSDNILKLTQRHLYEIETYITNPETQLQLHKVQNIIDNFEKIFEPKEKRILHEDLLFWLKDYNVRVSLLLRMGLQNMDGNFIVNNLNPIAEEMLRNLGENIYAVTQNGKILENNSNLVNNNNNNVEDQEVEKTETVNELQLFVDEMMGGRKTSSGSTTSEGGNFLKLSINDDNYQKGTENSDVVFDNIDVNIVSDGRLKEVENDFSDIEDDGEEDRSFRNDLLDLIDVEHS